MAFALSDLLNPAPASSAAAAGVPGEDGAEASSTTAPPDAFAPELFHSNDDAPLPQEKLAAMAMDAASALEVDGQGEQPGEINGLTETPQLKQEVPDDAHMLDASEYPIEGLMDHDHDHDHGLPEPHNERENTAVSQGQLKEQSADPKPKQKRNSPEDTKDKCSKSTKHSSKNEGQHTDRRYLCYICNKLFTRRRSVRDHISKIHNTKTWEPVRSLEIIVDPDSGEPIEPLEDIIARGPPPPPPKPDRAHKSGKPSVSKDSEEAEEVDTTVPAPEPQDAPEASPAPPSTVANLKTEHSVAGSRASSTEPFATPAPVISKKRPAPDSAKSVSAAVTKKGMAKIKNAYTPNKKAKLADTESMSERGTPSFRSPSATPASMQRTPASKLKKQTAIVSAASSPTPSSSRAVSLEPASPSPSSTGTPGSSNDDGEIFCICRKGDNHTWMIACDGGCDEWFHGNCVNIRERDGDLIDKYVCPNCTKVGFHTTWKRMCRRKGCRKPAKVLQDPPSKYCSKDCGRMFFVELIRKGDPYIDTMKNGQYVVEGGRTKKMRKKRTKSAKPERIPKAVPLVNGDVGEVVNGESRLATPAYSEDEKSEYETDSSADEDQLPNRGGALRAGEVRAIVDRCKTIDQWSELGRKPATPPREMDEMGEIRMEFDEFEKAKLDDLKNQTARLSQRNEMLDAREKFLGLIKARSTNIADEVKKGNPKMKDPCGFDMRLAWSEEEFLRWCQADGKAILDSGKIGPPDEDEPPRNGQESDSDDDHEKMPTKGGVCVRNRCPRHRNWAKGQLAELRFEQDVVKRGLRKCEDQERRIRERAVVKVWESRAAVAV